MADETTQTQAAAKPPRDEKNGILRPAPGTLIHKVWQTAEDLSKSLGRPATRAEVRDAIGDSVNPATTATQYARWTKYYGVSQVIKDHRAAQAAEGKKAKVEAKQAAKADREAKAAEKAAADKAKAEAAEAKEREKAEKAAAAEADKKAKAEAKEADKKAKADAKEAEKQRKAQEKAAAAEAAKAAKEAKAQQGTQAAA